MGGLGERVIFFVLPFANQSFRTPEFVVPWGPPRLDLGAISHSEIAVFTVLGLVAALLTYGIAHLASTSALQRLSGEVPSWYLEKIRARSRDISIDRALLPLAGLYGAFAFPIVAIQIGRVAALVPVCLFLMALLLFAILDFKTFLIPKSMLMAAAAFLLVSGLVLRLNTRVPEWLIAGGAALLIYACFKWLRESRYFRMSMGDVRLLSFATGFISLLNLALVPLMLGFSYGFTLLVPSVSGMGRDKKGRPLTRSPFAPAVALAGLATMLWLKRP